MLCFAAVGGVPGALMTSTQTRRPTQGYLPRLSLLGVPATLELINTTAITLAIVLAGFFSHETCHTFVTNSQLDKAGRKRHAVVAVRSWLVSLGHVGVLL